MAFALDGVFTRRPDAQRAVIEDARRRQRKRRRWTTGAVLGIAILFWLILPGSPWRPNTLSSSHAQVTRRHATGLRMSTCMPSSPRIYAVVHQAVAPPATSTKQELPLLAMPLVHACVFTTRH
jgi:hypothetical protein